MRGWIIYMYQSTEEKPIEEKWVPVPPEEEAKFE
jgi:hypothetical protein